MFQTNSKLYMLPLAKLRQVGNECADLLTYDLRSRQMINKYGASEIVLVNVLKPFLTNNCLIRA